MNCPKRDENNIAALSSLIDALVQDGKIGDAQALLDARLQQDSENPDLRFVRAGLYVAEGDIDQAEAIYRALLDEFPGAAQPLSQLSRLLVSQGREKNLTGVIEAAAAAQPDAALPKVLKAEQLERLRDFEGAIAVYEELYTENSANLIFANNLASLITTHRNDEESLSRAYAVARRLRASDVPAFQDTYGWIAFRRGNHSEALDHLKSAAVGLPEDPLVHYHLGETYMALGRSADAQIALVRAIDLFGGQELPQVERAQELLSTLSTDE